MNKKLSLDVLFTFAGQICVMAVLFGMNKYLSMAFQPELYTVYNIAYKSASVLATALVFCLGIAVPRYIALYIAQGNKDRSARIVQVAFLLILVLVAISLVFFIYLPIEWGPVIFNTHAFDRLLWGIVVYGIGIALTTFMYSLYRGIEDYKLYNGSQIFIQLFTLLMAFILSDDILSMMVVWGIGLVMVAIIGIGKSFNRVFGYSIYSMGTSSVEDIFVELKELLCFCLPRVPGEVVLFSLNVFPLIILNEKLGALATGGFVVALIINGAVAPLYGLTGTVLLPYVSRLMGESGDVSAANSKINKLMLIYVLSSLVIIGGVYCFAEYIIWILFDNSYMVYAPQVKLIILAVLPNAIYLLLRNPLDAASVMPYNTINLIVAFGILMGVLYLGNTVDTYIGGFIGAYTYLGISSWMCWLYCSSNKVAQEC